MNKIPKITYEVLKQVLDKFNFACEKIKNDHLSSEDLINLLDKYITELKTEQPAVYDWGLSMMDAYQMIEKPFKIEELFLFLVIFHRSLKTQQEIDDLDNLLKQ